MCDSFEAVFGANDEAAQLREQIKDESAGDVGLRTTR
jgi:hypothetical protein